jgi:hypothetical protein
MIASLKGTHSVPYEAVGKRLSITFGYFAWLKQIFLREKARAGFLIPNSDYARIRR